MINNFKNIKTNVQLTTTVIRDENNNDMVLYTLCVQKLITNNKNNNIWQVKNKMNPIDSMWTEKYRPTKLSEMVGDFKRKNKKIFKRT